MKRNRHQVRLGWRNDTAAGRGSKGFAAFSRRGAPALPRGCGRRRAAIPGGASSGTLRAGSRQRVKPICAASRTRSPAWPAPRTSPPRPTSPNSTVCGRQRPVAEGGGDGRRDAQVGRRLVDLEAAGDAHEHVVAQQLQPDALLEHGQQQVGAVGVDAERHPARRAERGRRDERLHLDQHRTRALDRGDHRRAGRRPPAARRGTAPRGWRPAAGRRPSSRRRPSSETAPKRFLTARTMRWCWRFSPSK